MGRSGLALAGAHGLAAAVVLAPLFLVPVPPLADYLTTVARMWVLANADGDPTLAANYAVFWGYFPYMATDLLLAPVMRWLPPLEAGRLFLAVVAITAAAGPILLNRVLTGRFAWWPLAAWLLVYHHVFFWGFLNYLLAASFAMLAFAAWLASERWPAVLRWAAFCTATALLVTFHLFAWGAYGLMIAGYEWHKLRQAGLDVRRLALAFSPFAVSLLPWLLLPSPTPGQADLVLPLHHTDYGGFRDRLEALLAPVSFHQLSGDFVLAITCALFFYWAVRSGRLSVDPRLIAPLVLLTVAALAMPQILFDIWGTHLRLPTLILPLLVGAASLSLPGRRAAGLLLAAGAAVLLIRTGDMALEWRRCQGPFAEVRAALAEIPSGVRLASVIEPDEGAPPCFTRAVFDNISAFAVLDRRAFDATMFETSTVFPAARHRDLNEAFDHLSLNRRMRLEDPRLAPLLDRPDYLLHLHFGSGPARPPAILEALRNGGYFTLYRVERDTPAAPVPGTAALPSKS